MKTLLYGDTDGDAILITNNSIVVKSFPAKSYMLYDDGVDGGKVANNWENRVIHFCRTAKISQVGLITNLASVHRDLSLHNGNPKLYDLKVIVLRFLQGWEIDSAKTGANVVIPEDLMTNAIPHWMVALKEYKKRSISKNAQAYHSLSACGALYDYVQEFIEGFKVTVQTEDKTFKFMKNVNKGEVVRIQDIVKAYEKQYVVDSAVLYTKYESMDTEDKKVKQQMNEEYNELYSKYASLLSTISDDETAIACAVYNSAYNIDKNSESSCSMPWAVCFNGMIQLLHLNNNATMLVKLPRYDEKPETVIVSNSGMLFINNEPVKHTNYDAGVYEVITLENAHYIRVARKEMVELETSQPTRYIEDKFYQFKVNGFKHLGLNPVEALDIIHANNNEFLLTSIADRTMVISGGRIVAYFNRESNAILPIVVNVKFRLFENEQPIYVPNKITANTVMVDDTKAYRGSLALVATPISGISEEEFKVISEITGSTISEEFVGVELETEEGMEVVYNAEPSMLIVEENAEVVTSGLVIEEEVVMTVSPAIDTMEESILSQMNLNAKYWEDNKTITAPASVANYDLAITNYSNFTPGTQIALVTAYTTTGVAYDFEVGISHTKGKGLEIRCKAGVNISATFANWLLRLVSYKATEMRLRA